MSTVSDFLTAIRDDIKDPDSEQFTDAQIIRYANRFRMHIVSLFMRYQISVGRKKGTLAVSSNTETYSIFSSLSDLQALEYCFLYNQSRPLTPLTIEDYYRKGLNTATTLGTSNNFMVEGTTIYLCNPKPEKTGTLDVWYYYLPAAITTGTATTNTMPYSGLIDEPWREFTSFLLLNREEYNAKTEMELFQSLEDSILSLTSSFTAKMDFKPGVSQDWDKDPIKAFYE